MKSTLWLLLLSAALLTACGRNSPPAPAGAAAPQPAHVSEGVAWYHGSVDEALAAAAREHKPVLLYWGASWCPPCHQLQEYVYSRPDFIAKSRLFVPVYLDGDDQGAQKWGEAFHVTGYPTLVILDSARHELLRIAGGLDLEQYAQALDVALGDVQPVEQLLASNATLAANDCSRLGYNAWLLDDVDSRQFAQLSDRLASAAERCAAVPEAAARLTLTAAYLASAAEPGNGKGMAPSARMNARIDAVSALLDRMATSGRPADTLYYLDQPFFAAVKARGADYAADFGRRFTAILESARHDVRFAAPDRLKLMATELALQKTLHGSVDAGLEREARERIQQDIAAEKQAYGRSALVNSALYIYDVLQDNQAAYDVVKAEVPRAAAPYYMKLDLAEICEDMGRRDEALKWYREAYAESRGAATRFQWGYSYLGALLRLQADDTATIDTVGQAVLSELAGNDRIYRRARIRLAQLDGQLRKWEAARPARRAPVLVSLHRRMQQICADIPAGDPAHASCTAFLAGAA